MDSIELKRRIKLMSGLPGLPPVVREVLVPAAQMDFEVLATHIAADAQLCQVLADAVPGARDVSDAVRALEVNALRRAILHHAMKALFPEGQGGTLDRAEFWQRANRCGEFAACLAQRVKSPHEDEAYAAGFLHNLGTLVLDALAPAAYARVIEAAEAGGAGLLEAERRELGLDHTLAGKWVAENWGLPEPYIAVMWLHHHPVGALDDTCYPVQLIELVRLAETMARMQAASGGDVAGPNPLLLERLAITRSAVEELIHPGRTLDSSERAALEGSAHDAQTHWQRRVLRLDLLEQFQARLAVLQHLAAVMDATAAAVREAFPAVWGCCCVTDEEFDCLEGRWWQAAGAPSIPFAAPLDGLGEGEVRAALPPPLDAVLPLLRDDATPQGWPGLLVGPVLAEGRSIGHIVLDFGEGAALPSEDDLSDLRLFGRAAGMTVAHLRAEQMLRTRNEEMAEALWRKEDVIQSRLRAARMAGVARLAAGASHEINNPLAIISGQAQMLMGRAVAAEQKRALESIIAQSRRASQILTDLMQFARPGEPRLEPMPLPFILRQVADEVRPGLENAGIQLVEDYFDRLPQVSVDRRRFEQVLHHLIDNASHAMAARGGTLTLRATPAVNRQLVKVQVIDTGPGIPAELHEEIFEPFFTTRQQSGATGLGLAVCHGIIDSHGGHLEVESRPGKGAVFSIVLPAAGEAVEPVAPPRPATARTSDVAESLREAARLAAGLGDAQPRPATAPVSEAPAPASAVRAAMTSREAASAPVPVRGGHAPGRATILITDDDVDLREVLKETFQARGYNALGASDAMEAQAMLVGSTIDLVILDLRLPRKDGLALMRELRARHAHIPVIVVTSLATEEELSEARRLGAHACMHKPFELKRLLAEIEEALRSRDAA